MKAAGYGRKTQTDRATLPKALIVGSTPTPSTNHLMTMTEEAKKRRKRLDHERYMRHQEERKAKQRAYYEAHKEQCKRSVKISKYKRYKRELYAILHETKEDSLR